MIQILPHNLGEEVDPHVYFFSWTRFPQNQKIYMST